MEEKQLLCTLLMLLPFSGMAEWFGPDNYEDCLLEKMQGQNKAMLNTARKACEKQFPYEKKLDAYWDDIEIAWGAHGSTLSLAIQKNFGDYTVTRYKAEFSQKSCDEATISDYTLTKTFVFLGGENTASVSVNDAEQYKCIRTDTVWGRLRK